MSLLRATKALRFSSVRFSSSRARVSVHRSPSARLSRALVPLSLALGSLGLVAYANHWSPKLLLNNVVTTGLLAYTRFRHGIKDGSGLCLTNGDVPRSCELKMVELIATVNSKGRVKKATEKNGVQGFIKELRATTGEFAKTNAEIAKAKFPHIATEEVVVDGVKCLYLRKRGKHPEFADLRKNESAISGALVNLHGGGYIAGTPQLSMPFMAFLVDCLEIPALLVDYTVAPESVDEYSNTVDSENGSGFMHIDESTKVIRWLQSAAGIPLSKVALIGDSAGGGMTMALVNYFNSANVFGQDKDNNHIGVAVAISQWSDLCFDGEGPRGRFTHESMEANKALDPMVNDSQLSRVAAHSAVFGSDAENCAETMSSEELIEKTSVPLISPLYGSYESVNTKVLLTASRFETLRDHSVNMYDTLIADGVKAELRLNDTNIHSLPCMDLLPEHVPELVYIASFIGHNLS